MTLPFLDDTLIHVAENRLGILLQADRRDSLTWAEQREVTRTMRTLAGRPGLTQLVLLAGLPGSGKTTIARELETRGYLRICPDERVFEQHGHYGRDFPRGSYKIRERPILTAIAAELRDALASGRDVVLDHGLWTLSERQEWREVGEAAGAKVTLVYLPATHEELWERIKKRNASTFDNPNAMYFTEEDLLRHGARFEPPGNGESPVVYAGSLVPVIEDNGNLTTLRNQGAAPA
ncbi:ATP/GTP-binding protein [Streptomyces xanthochromogenes]|uniref:AAA family ATPase n=1 Tax=Streptomyces xanthochromogenes TaxID=67384 RepID=UPI00167AC351|nr:ATP-binding protein [Streptomyces xanthochromogenes]GHB75821.1 ATP/GTP-binding protein [Streptomyces xanthochromogenes]